MISPFGSPATAEAKAIEVSAMNAERLEIDAEDNGQ